MHDKPDVKQTHGAPRAFQRLILARYRLATIKGCRIAWSERPEWQEDESANGLGDNVRRAQSELWSNPLALQNTAALFRTVQHQKLKLKYKKKKKEKKKKTF